jgi:hypothetical protein
MLTNAICRIDGDVKFSDILKEFKAAFSNNIDFYCNVDKNDFHEWLNVSLTCDGQKYEFTLHKDTYPETGKYKLLSMPYGRGKSKVSFLVNEQRVELEQPATNLSNPFDCYLVNLLISKSKITMDVCDFDEIDDSAD